MPPKKAPEVETSTETSADPQPGGPLLCLFKKQVKSEIADREGHDDVVNSPGKPTMLSQDKARYNKFQYRYKTAPQEVKEAWSQLQKEKNPEEMQKFMEEVIQTKGKYTSSFLTRCKTTKFEEMEGEEGGWISWSKAAEEEGGCDILQEMLQAKTIEIRRNPKLPASSSIPFPRNQQVRFVKEVFCRKRKRGEETRREDADEDPETVESFAATYDHFMHNNTNSASSTSAGSNWAPPGPGKDVGGQAERDKTTVTNLRKAHSLWDRSTRDFEALVRKSGSHPNTTGCKFEKDLALIIKSGASLDSAVKGFEQTFLEGKSFSDEEIKKAADVSNNVLKLVKEGQKKAAALRPWFKL